MKTSKFLITPMNQRVYLEPGQVYHGSIKVANPAAAESDFDFVAEVAPYKVIGEDYDVDLNTQSDWTKITNWITIENPTGTLVPNESRNIDFTITVPESVPGGAQHAVIIVRQDKDETVENGMLMENVFEMASIIYADVAGETFREAKILENKIPSFATNPDVVVEAMLENRGNTYEDATITITAKNTLSGEVILPTEVDSGVYAEIVIPDTVRHATRKVDNLPALGVVHIEQTVVYGGETVYEARDVLICPIWFMVMVVVAIGAVIGLIIRIVKKHKRKKAELL